MSLRNVLCAGFIGPQGSGKTTQARFLAELWKVPLIRTGRLLENFAGRWEDKAGEEEGLELRQLLLKKDKAAPVEAWIANIADAIPNGRPVCSEAVYAILSVRLAKDDCANGLVMDRIAMHTDEAKHNDRMLKERGIHPSCQVAILLKVTGATVQTHLEHRRVQEGRVDDLNPTSVATRLQTFYTNQQPLVDYYKRYRRLLPINGDEDPGKVFGQIKAGIRSRLTQVTVPPDTGDHTGLGFIPPVSARSAPTLAGV